MQKININALNITNSQLAQVQAYQKLMIQIFDKEYQGKQLPYEKDFYINLVMAAKFSIVRDFKQKDIIQLWKKWMQWYHKQKPYAISQNTDYIVKLNNTKQYRFSGKDKQGRQILYIRTKYHVKGLVNVDQSVKHMLYMLQKSRKLADELKTHQITMILDKREAQSDQVTKQTMNRMQKVLNDFYPQLLGRFFILGANSFFRGVWKVGKIFVNKRTEEKINLLAEPKLLLDHIDKENLAIEYGGTLDIDKNFIF